MRKKAWIVRDKVDRPLARKDCVSQNQTLDPLFRSSCHSIFLLVSNVNFKPSSHLNQIQYLSSPSNSSEDAWAKKYFPKDKITQEIETQFDRLECYHPDASHS